MIKRNYLLTCINRFNLFNQNNSLNLVKEQLKRATEPNRKIVLIGKNLMNHKLVVTYLKSHKIREVDCKNSMFTNEGLAAIIRLKTIKKVNAFHPRKVLFDEDDEAVLASAIRANPNLIELTLPRLTAKGNVLVIEALKNHHSLKSVSLTLNVFNHKDLFQQINAIKDMVKSNTCLETLHIHTFSNNENHELNVLSKIICALENNKNLKNLYIHNIKMMNEEALNALLHIEQTRGLPINIFVPHARLNQKDEELLSRCQHIRYSSDLQTRQPSTTSVFKN